MSVIDSQKHGRELNACADHKNDPFGRPRGRAAISKPQDSNVIIWPYIHYTHTQTIGVMWFRNRVHKANRRSFRSVRSRRAVGPCLSCCLPTQRNRPRSASPPVGRCTRVGCRRRRSRSRRRRRGARGRGPASNSPASSDSLPATGAGRATRRPPRRDSPRSGGPLRRGRGDRRTARRCQWCARRRARPTRSPASSPPATAA